LLALRERAPIDPDTSRDFGEKAPLADGADLARSSFQGNFNGFLRGVGPMAARNYSGIR
jgi:hypothetical protein